LEKAQALLDERGIDVQPVALKYLVPWFDGASLEDENDDDMVLRWATLLANAAAGEHGSEVSPSYIAILRELTPPEAALVDWLHQPYLDRGLNSTSANGRGVQEILHRLDYEDNPRAFAVLAENTMRLGLCATAWKSGGANLGGAAADMLPVTERLLPTQLGLAFVRACTIAPEDTTGAQTGAQGR